MTTDNSRTIHIRHILVTFLLIGLIQAFFTPIARDEAYYWMFANNLDWGYFDHPPLVALMAALGMFIFPDELGVRFITVLMMTATAGIIWRLLPEENREKEGSALLFGLILFTNPLFTIYSFTTTPDVPLLFFAALFFYVLRLFQNQPGMKTGLLLGVTMAGLIYAKYHGILIILFTLAARLKLLRNPWYYLAALTGIVLYIPHLVWQYNHDFVSFEYHLFYRSVSFAVKNVFMYFLNLLLVLNPLIIPVFVYGFVKDQDKSIQSREMNFILWGFIIFFAFTSFRGHVEPHWIAVTIIPITIYLHHYLIHQENLRKWFRRGAWSSVVILLAARIAIILPLPIKSEYHSRGAHYYKQVKETASGRPVVYVNSYTDAARYSFYTGDPCYSYNFISYRKNQYDLLDGTEDFHQKDVMLALNVHLDRFDTTRFDDGELFFYHYYDNMPLINKLKAEILEYNPVADSGEYIDVTISLKNPYDFDIEVFDDEYGLLWEMYFFDLTKERVGGVPISKVPMKVLKAENTVTFNAVFPASMPKGEYTLGVGIRPKSIFPLSASKRTYPFTVR